ncbi:MAG: TonB-dependent receptor [Lewinella sp.]|nr:TonB-dependent receptor [Lewinella sp.]
MPRFILPILLLLGLAWNIQAQNRNATVSIDAVDLTLTQIMEEITVQTGFYFSFNARAIDADQRITFSIRDARLDECLRSLGEQIQVSYQIIDDQIILKALEEEQPKEELLILSGFIEDGSSGESLIGATASVPGTPWGAVTNAFGYYSLPLKRDKYQLEYSYVGYEKKEVDLELSANEQRNVSILPQSIELPNVIVEIPALARLQKKQISQLSLHPDDLNNMPEFGGESGLVKGLQSLPGMQMHGDGSAFFYARGGERDQNVIIIDDAPIFNPSHLFGFYSIVIPEFAKSIQVYKSNVPANLGDRLSSIVDIRTKDGNLNKLEFSGALNPLINRFSLEAPIIKKRLSLFVSWRRSRFEWLYQKAAPDADLSFGDFNFKLNYRINDKNRLFFTTIISGDNFTNLNSENRSISGLRWANLAATLRWNHIFGPKLFSNTTIYTGNYGYRLFIPPSHWQSALGSLSFKTDFTHYARPNYTARFGLEAHGYFIDPGSFAVDSSIAILPEIKPNFTQKTVLYYQGEWDLNDRWQLRAGARLINWTNTGPTTYYTFNEKH